jgi:DNA helicase INO80
MQDSQLHAGFSEELQHEFETIEAAPAQLVHLPIGASEAQIEMARTKIWSKISTQLVPRVFRMRLMTQSNAINNASIVAQLCQRELRKRDTSRINFKESMCISVSKKMNREMAVFWKRNEKDEREARKRAEKEMTER